MKKVYISSTFKDLLDYRKAATHDLVPACNIRTVKKKGPLNKLHHKLMVIDEQVVIAGSFNYTEPANKLNDENIIIIGDRGTDDANEIAEQKKIGAYAKKEIDRIYNTHGEAFVSPL